MKKSVNEVVRRDPWKEFWEQQMPERIDHVSGEQCYYINNCGGILVDTIQTIPMALVDEAYIFGLPR